MPSNPWPLLILALIGLLNSSAPGVQGAEPKAEREPTAGAVAATVNGQPILEVKLRQAVGLPPEHEHFAEQRLDALEELIDRVLVDQHVVAQNVTATAKEIDAELVKFKE